MDRNPDHLPTGSPYVIASIDVSDGEDSSGEAAEARIRCASSEAVDICGESVVELNGSISIPVKTFRGNGNDWFDFHRQLLDFMELNGYSKKQVRRMLVEFRSDGTLPNERISGLLKARFQSTLAEKPLDVVNEFSHGFEGYAALVDKYGHHGLVDLVRYMHSGIQFRGDVGAYFSEYDWAHEELKILDSSMTERHVLGFLVSNLPSDYEHAKVSIYEREACSMQYAREMVECLHQVLPADARSRWESARAVYLSEQPGLSNSAEVATAEEDYKFDGDRRNWFRFKTKLRSNLHDFGYSKQVLERLVEQYRADQTSYDTTLASLLSTYFSNHLGKTSRYLVDDLNGLAGYVALLDCYEPKSVSRSYHLVNRINEGIPFNDDLDEFLEEHVMLFREMQEAFPSIPDLCMIPMIMNFLPPAYESAKKQIGAMPAGSCSVDEAKEIIRSFQVSP